MSEFSIDGISFSWYEADIKKIAPKGNITMRQFINSVLSPKESLKETFLRIEQASKDGNEQLKAELKKGLFATTPCVQVQGIRNYEAIKSFNNILVIEYDKISFAPELRDYVFEKFNSCFFAFLSPSKGGCKFLFRIKPVSTILEFKELFWGLAYELDKFRNLDLSGANCVLPLFVSWDEDAKVRENPTEWTQRGYKETAFVPTEIDFDLPEDVDAEIEQEVIKSIEFLIEKIDDNAHPQLRSTSFLIGGWVAGNNIGQEIAFDTMNESIRNNNYMQKGLDGYLLTSKTMFQKGLNFPKEFKKYESRR